MKRLSVFVPFILLAIFLLNSFVLKEKDAGKVIKNKKALRNTVFKSTDGGQTWQDIGKGLPGNLREVGIRGDSIFANDKGLFLRVGNEIYHSTANGTAPFWTKEILPDSEPRDFGEHSSIAPTKSGIVAYNRWAINMKRPDGTSVWSILENPQDPGIYTTFETAGGTFFIGTGKGFFKTTNDGKTWKHVRDGGLTGHLAESNGVLLAISMRKIIRSTDDGENWVVTTSEDSVAFDVKPIKGGFVAITSNSESNSPHTSRLSTSYDGGKTWQLIDAGPHNKHFIDSIWRTWNNRPRIHPYISSINQIGENLFCAHPQGIFRSSDKGKTWKILLPSIDGKIFHLFVSGNVIYAIPSKGGC
jgi:photosystem II stability/assembly factor-like uncharacterized protein